MKRKIVILKRELRNPDLADYEKGEREIALSNAEEALRLFRRAYDLEQKGRILASAGDTVRFSS